MKNQLAFSICASAGLHIGGALLVPWPDGAPEARDGAALVVLEISEAPAAAEDTAPQAPPPAKPAPEPSRRDPAPPAVVQPDMPDVPPVELKTAPAAKLPPPKPVASQPADSARKAKSATTVPVRDAAAGTISGVRYRERAALSYPVSALRQRLAGLVILIVEIDEDGRAAGITVSRSSGHAALDRAAIDCARQSSYEPFRVNGVSRHCRVEAPFEFKLPDNHARPVRN